MCNLVALHLLIELMAVSTLTKEDIFMIETGVRDRFPRRFTLGILSQFHKKVIVSLCIKNALHPATFTLYSFALLSIASHLLYILSKSPKRLTADVYELM